MALLAVALACVPMLVAPPAQAAGSAVTVSDLAVGTFHSCAVLSDGTVRCWGRNLEGQLGDGTTTNSPTPVTVVGITTARHIAAGNAHTCAILADTTVRCWGRNVGGQLGNGSTTDSSLPVTVTGLSGVDVISLGDLHSCALSLTSGEVRCWGNNSSGQIGDSTTTSRSTPVAVSGITTAIDVSAGNEHTCAVLSDGAARCWGRNFFGQLGNGASGDGSNSATPVAVSGITGASLIAAAGSSTCAVVTGGAVSCWGQNSLGQLGDGTTTSSLAPVAVSSLTGATSITAGNAHTCVIVSGTIRCWGFNSSGQLGDGSTTSRSEPVAVGGLTGIAVLSAGGNSTCATNANGDARWCWGNGGNGQLGDGGTTSSSIPVTIAFVSGQNLEPSDTTSARTGPALTCTPQVLTVGATVTCEVRGGDPGIDILWRAAINPGFAEAGVTLDMTGQGTFAFTVPSAALGRTITVELVEWTAPIPLGTVSGPLPTALPAGEGPVSRLDLLGAASLALLTLMLLTIAAVMLEVQRRRWSS
jgi:alpha-tubulin suppressor-like RCC1 family protein